MAEGLRKMATSDDVVPELVPLGVAQSLHCYAPGELTHYRTWLSGSDKWPEPGWPAKRQDGSTFGRKEMEELYKPWGDLTKQGIGVFCGEFGVSSNTPNSVAIRFYTDLLEILQGYGIGWTYLSLHGGFTGLLDSDRKDVPYEDYHGHKLNRQMLTLLQKH